MYLIFRSLKKITMSLSSSIQILKLRHSENVRPSKPNTENKTYLGSEFHHRLLGPIQCPELEPKLSHVLQLRSSLLVRNLWPILSGHLWDREGTARPDDASAYLEPRAENSCL